MFIFRNLFEWCKFDYDNCLLVAGSSVSRNPTNKESTIKDLFGNQVYLEYEDHLDNYLLKQEAKKLTDSSSVMKFIDEGTEERKKEKVSKFIELSRTFANEMINGVNIELVLGDGKAHVLHLSLNKDLNALYLRRSGKKLILPLNIVSLIEIPSEKLISEAPELQNVDDCELERIVAISTVSDDWYIFIMKDTEMRDRFYQQMRLLVASIKISLVGSDRYWGKTYNGPLMDSVHIESDDEAVFLFQEEGHEFVNT
ncbi:uncharacterized protein cubi_01388 [Cryptosporidium ubiquitum]|uniref:Uncharacterized protein n=1 Tax=Cryptosporidium ubiquitum TaxID=857276 RepID=A0A1J4MDJ8_9CRYT|nr:uncharacterized protein cubi_01388 [Cryptosporidium ubiquitum]OII72055.1 hypothetical protein cubi_01388 [Cryptosporidium ubiquitum]